LNPYVDVSVIKDFKDEDIGNYSVICVTDNLFSLTRLIEINKRCRTENSGFVLAETLGPMVYAFLDYGKHVIFDADGEQTKPFIISSITQDENPTVTVHEDKRHTF